MPDIYCAWQWDISSNWAALWPSWLHVTWAPGWLCLHSHLPLGDSPHSWHLKFLSSPCSFTLYPLRSCYVLFTLLFRTSQGTPENLSHSHFSSCSFITCFRGEKHLYFLLNLFSNYNHTLSFIFPTKIHPFLHVEHLGWEWNRKAKCDFPG